MKDVYEVILISIEAYTEKKIFEGFLNYYERNFIGKDNSFAPLFDHCRWIVFERIKTNLPTTTNSLERWHRELNSIVSIRKLNLGLFIDSMRLETEKYAISLLYIPLADSKYVKIPV
ncbi:hypothetical protein DMUE_2005 [Dictyocoela muelleri]|nr:hypothetical protein DMUE_2005 [Dictyocoela muelleri]